MKKTLENNALDVIREKVSPPLFKMLECQVRNYDRHPNARRYTDEEKAIFLGLHKRGRSSYNCFPIIKPTRKTLRLVTKKFNLKPGYNSLVLEPLKARADNMKDHEKDVIIIFDETSAKKGFYYDAVKDEVVGVEDLGNGDRRLIPADEVLIAVARSVFHQWKQPIAYRPTSRRLSGGDFAKLFSSTIESVQATGLNVRCVLVDGLGKNITALEILGARTTRPYFYLNGQKVYSVSDVSHLIKCLRNALLLYELFLANGTVIKKEYIDTFVRFDMQITPRLARKVTEAHLNPGPFQKMNVAMAKQLLSKPVATGITMMAMLNAMPREALHTAKFCERISDLFDSTNGVDVIEDTKENFKCAVTKNSQHCNFWRQMIIEISQWKFQGSRNLQFPENWAMSLTAFLMLWEDLQTEGHEYFPVGNVNSDPIENFNSILRDMAGPKRCFTIADFPAVFASGLVNVLTASARGKNCRDDNALNMLQLNVVCDAARAAPPPPPPRGLYHLEMHTSEEEEELVHQIEDEDEIDHEEVVDYIPFLSNEDFHNQMRVKAASLKAAHVVAPIVHRHCKELNCDDCQKILQSDGPLFPLHLLHTLDNSNSATIEQGLPSQQVVNVVEEIFKCANEKLPACLHHLNIIENFIQYEVLLLPSVRALNYCEKHQDMKTSLLWDIAVAALKDILLVTNQFFKKKQPAEKSQSKKYQIVTHQ